MKNKIYDVIFFVGGAGVFIYNLTKGYYSRGGTSVFGGYSTASGFESWSVIGMAIGVCLIVIGFLRRSWDKKEKEK